MKLAGLVGERVDLSEFQQVRHARPRARRAGPPPPKPSDRRWAEQEWAKMSDHERMCVTMALGDLLGPPA